MFRVIVAGGRDFDNYELLKDKLDKLLSLKASNCTIVSGAARGADNLGEVYAEEKGYLLSKFPAQWDKFGKSAGYRRNEEMAKNADGLVAFWDGQSRGTKHMIDIAKAQGLAVRVINY